MNLTVTSSPHIRSKENTRRIMLDVIIALMPTLIAGTLVFGLRALVVTLVSVVSCVVSEALFCLICRKPVTIGDYSAAVTGLLLALTLPATVPYWLVALGGIFAMVVVKGMSGGLGHNVFNPALSARALMMLLFPVWMVRYAAPGADLPIFGSTVDTVTAATALHHMVMPALPQVTLTEAFLGKMTGSIGEVSSLALLLGAAWLLYRKVITLRVPLGYLGSMAVLTLVFHKTDTPVLWMLYSLLSGGVIMGAFYMANDFASTPVTLVGEILYGVGCGVFTVIFRYYGLFPEGFTYAILLMNAFAWAIDRYTAPRRFGVKKGGKA